MSNDSQKELTKQAEKPVTDYKHHLQGCKYPESIGYEIIGRMAGGEPVIKIADDPHMPSLSQIMWWLQGTVEGGAAGVLAAYYAQARAVRADVIGNKVDFLIDDQASENPTRKHQNARVALDAARWYIGRLGSKRWQEPTQQHHVTGNVTLSTLLQQAQSTTGDSRPGSVLDAARGRVIEGETVEPVDNKDK